MINSLFENSSEEYKNRNPRRVRDKYENGLQLNRERRAITAHTDCRSNQSEAGKAECSNLSSFLGWQLVRLQCNYN